ncbi:uracil-DNA glycosylase [Peribacillus acanthi]|uniref:uracil-DNA glycosylase n=1 Tax=Peribacillus acanthi TaxID=2171554 RepID=UPI000D3E066C|nr:uracil-DNA glycosylase [Peribacillus acanthi]
MKQIFKNDWNLLLEEEFLKDYYVKLREFLKHEYSTTTVFPASDDIFNALHSTSYHDVKAVILGQDPYHGKGQAHGMSFSVQPQVAIPPSLKNIYKELQGDLGFPIPNHGYLKKWAEQGVLLLNTVLTVREGQANSHKGLGWEIFTDRIISVLNDRDKPMVFILWGSPAYSKSKLIDRNKHFIVSSPHPSPLSAYRGFFGSKPFSETNRILREMGEEEIDWYIPNL